jgi:hypothetical protein
MGGRFQIKRDVCELVSKNGVSSLEWDKVPGFDVFGLLKHRLESGRAHKFCALPDLIIIPCVALI